MELVVKNPPVNAGDLTDASSFNPWVSKIPWRRARSPLQYSCLENPTDGGRWPGEEGDKTGGQVSHDRLRGRHTLQGRLLFSGPPGCSQDLCGALHHMVCGRGTLSEGGLWTPAPPPHHTHTHPYLAGCFALAESPQTVAGRPGAVAGRWLGARSPRTLLPGPSQLGLNEPHAPATTGAAPTSLFPQTLPGPLGAYLRGPHVQGLQVGRPKGPARSPTC